MPLHLRFPVLHFQLQRVRLECRLALRHLKLELGDLHVVLRGLILDSVEQTLVSGPLCPHHGPFGCFKLDLQQTHLLSVLNVALLGQDALPIELRLPRQEIGAFLLQAAVQLRAFDPSQLVAFGDHLASLDVHVGDTLRRAEERWVERCDDTTLDRNVPNQIAPRDRCNPNS